MAIPDAEILAVRFLR